MKPITFITLVLFLWIMPSCKKDKEPEPAEPRNFTEINRTHIRKKESLMSDAPIQVSGVNNGVSWELGDVYLYRTRSGLFGKFRVGAIEQAQNHRLTISAVTYKDDGSVHGQAEKLVIRGTFGADLEALAESISGSDLDFFWQRQNQETTIFNPTNGAAFIVHRFD